MKISSTLALLTLCAVMNDVCAMQQPQDQSIFMSEVHDDKHPFKVGSPFQLGPPNSVDGSQVIHEDGSRLEHLQNHAYNNQNNYFITRDQFNYFVMAKVEATKDYGNINGQLVAEQFRYWAPHSFGKEYNKIRAIQVNEKKDCDASALREAAFYDVIDVYVKHTQLLMPNESIHHPTEIDHQKIRLSKMAVEMRLKYLGYVLSAFAGKNTARRGRQFNSDAELKQAPPSHVKSGLHYNDITTNGPVTDILSRKKKEIKGEVVTITKWTMDKDMELKAEKEPNAELQMLFDGIYRHYIDTTAQDIVQLRAELFNLHVTLRDYDNLRGRFCALRPEVGRI